MRQDGGTELLYRFAAGAPDSALARSLARQLGGRQIWLHRADLGRSPSAQPRDVERLRAAVELWGRAVAQRLAALRP
jgi:hypothetical protein